MKLVELADKSILILGLGVEGRSTYQFLRSTFPRKEIGIADRRSREALATENLAAENAALADPHARLHLGDDYLSSLYDYDVILKTPGISAHVNQKILEAERSGRTITSHTEVFFANCPGRIIGVTGTKGKGTTSTLIYNMLKAGGREAHLVGNVGRPPLPLLASATRSSIFVFEMSAQQLEHLHDSPHIAVLLNIVSDHLDHFATFEDYVAAKSNITRFQSADDCLVFNAMFPIPSRIAGESKAQLVPCSIEKPQEHGAFLEGDRICWRSNAGETETVFRTGDVEAVLPGSFNLHNVLPAVAVAKLIAVATTQIGDGLRQFRPLAHRFDLLGTFKGIRFYNAPIATVPEVTIEHINSLGDGVQTILLGGRDRSLDFTGLADRILGSGIETVILFPETGSRIREALNARASRREHEAPLPELYSVKGADGASAMEEAVRLAYLRTSPGRVCLHSPASSSFGLFRDYRERGELFARFVSELANE